MIEYGRFSVDPQKNPAVLDTATWDRESAAEALAIPGDEFWRAIAGSGPSGTAHGVEVLTNSIVHESGAAWALVRLPDGQRALVSAGRVTADEPQAPILTRRVDANLLVRCFEASDRVLDWFCRRVNPVSGPRALGTTPRLGIGCRLSTAVWPATWDAMQRGGFAANAIQNSLRELNLLAELRAGLPPRSNYQFSFGRVQEGHTGSTFEGLWLEGVLSAMESGRTPRYGADADHIMVKRTDDGIERAKHIVEAARYYSFYTLDVSDLLDYAAIGAGDTEMLERVVPDAGQRQSVLRYHQQGRRIGGVEYKPTEEELAGLLGKHNRALEAAAHVRDHIRALKGDGRFDFELSIDENPADVRTCENLTSEVEMIFLLLEGERRGLELTHIAPNLGVEKGVDYRCPGGLDELGERLRRLIGIAGQFGVMIDCHSGDDLSQETRRVIGDASSGYIHFKVSPALQVLFGHVLFELHSDLFRIWWDDALAYARREAEEGSAVAAESLRELASGDGLPDPTKAVFHHFNFATLGRRDEENRFISRDWFYSLPGAVYEEYTRRLELFLVEIARDVFMDR